MKQLILFFICMASFANVTISQPIWTDANNKRIMEWNYSYQIESKSFRADSNYEINYHYAIRKQNKLIAEYFRHDDTSYLFVQYDTSGNRLQRGLLKYYSEIFDSIKVPIPDWKSDPDGSKGITYDTIVYDYSLRKNGIWWEKDIYGMIWKGAYKNGLREGEWKEGTLVCCNETSTNVNDALFDLLRPYINHTYQNGIEIEQYKSVSFWPNIKGSWYYHHNLRPNQLVFERVSNGKDLNFISNETVLFSNLLINNHSTITKAYFKSKWRQTEDFLKIKYQEKTLTFKILRLDNFYLILERIE